MRFFRLFTLVLSLFCPLTSTAQAAENGKILMLITSTGQISNTGAKTGFWFEEMSTPYYIFQEAGYQVDLASTQGGEPPVDPASVEGDKAEIPSVKRFHADKDAMNALRRTAHIASVKPSDYKAVFIPGGHGAMFDFPGNRHVKNLLEGVWNHGGALGAVCHGPAALVDVMIEKQPLVNGKRINAFTNLEESTMKMTEAMPFALETKLSELGGQFESSVIPFRPYAVRDGRLVTGQNPASSEKTAHLLLEAIADSGL